MFRLFSLAFVALLLSSAVTVSQNQKTGQMGEIDLTYKNDPCGNPLMVSHAYFLFEGIVKEVKDGDTLVVTFSKSAGGDGSHQPEGTKIVHLAGIVAPNLEQPFGKESQQHLSSLILGKSVSILLSDFNQIVRQEFTAQVGNILNSNQEQLKAGLAQFKTDGRYSLDWYQTCQYKRSEEVAKQARRGLWKNFVPQ
jgi:endonuclease YncB( thermonuclease family)